jgi:hypothetical protein
VKRFERIAFAAGLLLFAALVVRLGPERIGRQLLEIGWGFLPVLALSCLPQLFNALSWQRVLPGNNPVRLAAMTRMLIAGEAVNAVSPVGVVGGELVRLSQLSQLLPAEAAAASVAMAALAQFCGQIVFVVTGLPLVLPLVRAGAVRTGLLVFAALLVALLALVLWLAGSAAGRRLVIAAAERVGILRRCLAAVPERWRAATRDALAALGARPGRFAAAVGFSLLAWQTGAVETWLILRFLRAPLSPTRAYAVEVLAVAIEGAFFFVPAKIGTQEGGKALIFLAAGLDPAKGFTLGLVRRLRELCWAAVGLGLLGNRARRRPTPSRAGAVVIPRG